MSALRTPRTLAGIVSLVYDELRLVAANEGEDGAYLLDGCDVSADFTRLGVVAAVAFRGKVVWTKEFMRITPEALTSMDDVIFKTKITDAMRGTLSLAGQMQHARLAQQFPNAIEEVRVHYSVETAQKIFHVKFKNGHVAEATEQEIKTDLFTARCIMIYDLPPI